MQHHLVFVDMKYFFVLHQHFFVDMKYLFVKQHIFVETKLFFVQHQTFYFNTKLFFVQHQIFVLFRMLCHRDIFLWSHSNKNIITCQRINKLLFLCDTIGDTKKLILFAVHPNLFIFSFYIIHCQHVGLLCSVPGNKETLTIVYSLF